MTSVIYVITNIITDKQYVGQAVVKDKRWKNHRIALRTGKHTNKKLQASYNKYGVEAFIYTLVEKVTNLSKLTEREDYWINKLNTVTPNGYNLMPASDSIVGFKHTEETKQRWSEQRKGKKRSPEFSYNLSVATKGIKRSAEAKEKMRLAQLGSTKSVETKAKHSTRMMGNSHNKGKTRKEPMPEETRSRISEAKKAGYAKRKAERKEALDKLWNLNITENSSSWPDP